MNQRIEHAGCVGGAEVLRLGKRMAQQEACVFQRREERVSFARMLCASTVEALWKNVFRSESKALPLPELFVPMAGLPKGSKLSSVAATMGEAASALKLETAAYLISSMYAILLPERQRSHGTNPQLARRLLDMASRAGINWRACSVCDPACGGGAFLIPLAKRFVHENRHVAPKLLVRALSQRLRGWDVDPFAAWLSQVFLELSVMDLCRKAGQRLPIMVEVGDSLLRQDVRSEFDLVIGDPPCGRSTLLQEVRYRYRRTMDGPADLYGLFADLAVRLTRRGGIISYVTPPGFLANQCFKSLRRLLANEASPVNIDFVSHGETLLLTYKVGSRNSVASVHQISARDGGIRVMSAGCFKIPPSASDAWSVPGYGTMTLGPPAALSSKTDSGK